MRTGVCSVELHLYDAQSLKDKRQIIKSLIARMRAKFNVSIAEIDHHDIWESAVLGMAVVSTDTNQIERIFNEIIKAIDQNLDIEIVRIEREIL